MIERLPDLHQPELAAPHPEKLLEAPEADNEYQHQELEAQQQASLEASRETIAAHAKEAAETPTVEQAKAAAPLLIDRELKDMTFQRTLRRARKNMALPGRVMSKIVHQPVIEAASEFGSKTVARPSGILGGSLFALAGSSALLYYAKHYGFTYNFLAFVLLFAAGFVAGVALEALFSLRKLRS